MSTNDVIEQFGCPNCKEVNTDKLLINDEDEEVECLTCGCKYRL
jgi:Zn ribbon nucleic-acid-binding protein